MEETQTWKAQTRAILDIQTRVQSHIECHTCRESTNLACRYSTSKAFDSIEDAARLLRASDETRVYIVSLFESLLLVCCMSFF